MLESYVLAKLLFPPPLIKKIDKTLLYFIFLQLIRLASSKPCIINLRLATLYIHINDREHVHSNPKQSKGIYNLKVIFITKTKFFLAACKDLQTSFSNLYAVVLTRYSVRTKKRSLLISCWRHRRQNFPESIIQRNLLWSVQRSGLNWTRRSQPVVTCTH